MKLTDLMNYSSFSPASWIQVDCLFSITISPNTVWPTSNYNKKTGDEERVARHS